MHRESLDNAIRQLCQQDELHDPSVGDGVDG